MYIRMRIPTFLFVILAFSGQCLAQSGSASYLDYNGPLVSWPSSSRPEFTASIETTHDEENSYENLVLRGAGKRIHSVPAEGFVLAEPDGRYSILFQHQIIRDAYWGLSYFNKGLFGAGEFSDDIVRGYLKALLLRKPADTKIVVHIGPDEPNYVVDFPVLGAYGKHVVYEVSNEEEKITYMRMEFFCPLPDGSLIVLTYQNHPGRFESMFPMVKETFLRTALIN